MNEIKNGKEKVFVAVKMVEGISQIREPILR